MLSLLDLFRIGMNAVKMFPLVNPVRKCLQLQTFRVLQKARGDELGTDNLGAVATDKDNPFFWSRAWARLKSNPNSLKYDYPLLTMFEVSNETGMGLFSKGFKRTYTIEIAALDLFREDCTGPGKKGCEARPINQIFIDTEMLLDSALQYFGKTVIATTSDHPVTPKVYYLPYLKAQKDAGVITSYAVKYALEASLNTANARTRFARVEYPLKGIYGTKAMLSFVTQNCPVVTYNTNLPDFGSASFEAGCQDCQ